MAQKTWQGGATAVTQIETFTLNNDFNNSETEIKMTMTAEDGTTQQSVTIDPSGTDESTIATAWHVALNASEESLFVRVTWTVATTVVTGTAKTSGIPFYAASSVTGGAGTITDSETTASVGPLDVNSTANYVGGAKTASADDLVIAPHPTDLDDQGVQRSYDMRYGLNQAAIDPASVRRATSYRGVIGSTADSFYLNFGTITLAVLDCQNDTWLRGDAAMTTLRVLGGLNSVNMLHVGDNVTNAYILGPKILGTVTFRDLTDIVNLWVNAPNGRVVTSNNPPTATNWELLAGNITIQDAADTVGSVLHIGSGAFVEMFGDETFVTINNRGGQLFYNGSGTITNLNTYDGLTSFDKSTVPAVIVTNSNTYGGVLSAVNGLNNVTWTNARILHGGKVDAETGITLTKS